jgi:hypothetical protein
MMEQDDGFTLEKAKEQKFESLPVCRENCPPYETQGIKRGVFSSPFMSLTHHSKARLMNCHALAQDPAMAVFMSVIVPIPLQE